MKININIGRAFHWKFIVPMAFFIAWLWSFPLFGHLQAEVFPDSSAAELWNVLFLFGAIIGFMSHLLPVYETYRKLPIAAIVYSMLVLLYFSANETMYRGGLLEQGAMLSGFLLGVAGSFYMVRWAVGLAALPREAIGRHMGMMMLLASGLHTLNLLPGEGQLAFYMGILFLVPAAFLKGTAVEDGEAGAALAGASSEGEKSATPGRSLFHRMTGFWIPFGLILGAFYLFSGILLNDIFPTERIEFPVMYLLSTLVYGVTALATGLYLDRYGRLESVVLLGIVVLGGGYFLSPFLETLDMVSLGLEVSYALIDVFIWVGIAYASGYYRYNPPRCFGFGLGLNLVFVLAGYVAMGAFIGRDGAAGNLDAIAQLVGVLLLVSVFPARAMKKLEPEAVVEAGSEPEVPVAVEPMAMPDNLTPGRPRSSSC